MRPVRSTLALGILCGACSSTVTKQASKPCGSYDGCLTVPVRNADYTPFKPGTEPDGKGTLYVGLIDQCPSPTVPTFKVISPVTTIVDVDLTSANVYTANVDFFFTDPLLDTTYSEGDTVQLGGIFDDVGDATADAPIPGPNDSALGCAPFKLARGHTQQILALGPCLLLQTTGAPYVYQQDPLTNVSCEAVAPPDAGVGGAGGASGTGGRAGSGGGGAAGAP